MEIRTGLSYGDVLLVPQHSPVDSRSDMDFSTSVALDLRLDTPFVSVAMDTITEAELTGALSGLGGLSVVHHFLGVDEQVEQVRRIAEAGGTVAGVVGIDENYPDRTEALLGAGAGAIVVNIAHGHVELCLSTVERIRDEFDPEIVAGNVVTPAVVEDLWEAGAGCVKVGVRSGSHYTIHEVAGAGYPQLTAASEYAERAHDFGIHVMVDGGIRTSGDAAKALMAGADTVIMGSFFAGTDEAPGRVIEVDSKTYKRSRGMVSTEAADDREDEQSDIDAGEGVEVLTPYKGPVEPLVEGFLGGIHPGMSCCGGHTLTDAHEKTSFVRAAVSAKECEGAHGVVFAEGPVEVDEEAERELQAPMAD